MAYVKEKCVRFICFPEIKLRTVTCVAVSTKFFYPHSQSCVYSREAGSAMSSPFLGEVRPWALNFAPRGWLMCQGQILPISQFTALFSLLGTIYGGNGTTNFALPDLRSRVPMKFGTDANGNNYVIGEQGGEEAVTITSFTLPIHNHAFSGTTSPADIKRPVTGSAFAQSTTAQSVSPGNSFYAAADSHVVSMNPNTVQIYGAGLPHENRQPFLAINWCIAVQGIFPSRN